MTNGEKVIIYIVQGTSGEYSDRSDWLVCAYTSKKSAEEHAHKAMLRAVEIHKSSPGFFSRSKENEFDPDMQMDYTGTEYTVLETNLITDKP